MFMTLCNKSKLGGFSCVTKLFFLAEETKKVNLNLLIKLIKSCSSTLVVQEKISIKIAYFLVSKRCKERVWDGLMCTTTMDKLRKLGYNNQKLQYHCREKVGVPLLEMVDDIVTASICGSTSFALNQTVNTFVDLKKLKLSKNKCYQIHVSDKLKQCPTHLGHGGR